MKHDILYYDGSCPLCDKEINWLRRCHNGHLTFQNIHEVDTAKLPANKESMLRILHLYTANNVCLLGIDATVRAWSHTSYGWLLKPLRWPIIKSVVDALYNYWAKKRYQKRYECMSCKWEKL